MKTSANRLIGNPTDRTNCLYKALDINQPPTIDELLAHLGKITGITPELLKTK